MRRLTFGLITVATLSALAGRRQAEAAVVDLNVTQVVTQTRHYLPKVGGSSVLERDFFTGTDIPTHTTRTLISSYGDTASYTHLDWFGNSGQTVFEFGMQHDRASSGSSTHSGAFGHIIFTANTDTTYDASGIYTLSGESDFWFGADLWDKTASRRLFMSDQVLKNAADESFLLGEKKGDHFNQMIGNLTGTLLANHTYRFGYYAYHQQRPTYSTATASGDFTLKIGEVPAPSSLTCVAGLFAMTMIASWWRCGRGFVVSDLDS